MSDSDQRGFAVYAELTDTYGAEIVVKQSSSAESDRCWIFVEGGPIARAGGDRNDGAAHLNTEQAAIVRDALDEFLSEHDKAVQARGLKEAIDFLYACKAAVPDWDDDTVPWHWATNALMLGIAAREKKPIMEVVDELHARMATADAEASADDEPA